MSIFPNQLAAGFHEATYHVQNNVGPHFKPTFLKSPQQAEALNPQVVITRRNYTIYELHDPPNCIF